MTKLVVDSHVKFRMG